MPHPCETYPWFDPAGSLIHELTEQRDRWGAPGWACAYGDQNAYTALVTLQVQLAAALSDPSPWSPQPWNPVVPPFPPGNVLALANAVSLGLPGDETNVPMSPISPHVPGPGWLLTPAGDPNWAAIERARDLLERVRDAVDM